MRKELPWALAVFLTALGLYWLTLAPGLIGIVDTPKLQFIGAILGVPHPPGYPLYVLLSYAFSHLPFGSLAYRINFMSAVFGAATVALVFLCGRRIGAGRIASGIGAVGLASGPLFWSTAVVAEVYTLHTALLAATLVSVLSWARTRSVTAYFTAVGCVALSVGHHTTMLLLGPSFAAYVLCVDARFALLPRRLVWTAALLVFGLVPYGLIALRTAQGAVFVETPIASFTDAWAAVSSRRWQSSLFAFDLPTLFWERMPFVATTLLREYSWAGAAAVTGGALYMLSRRRALGALLVLSGLINAAFVLAYDINEISVFLLPTVVTGWLCATVLIGDLEPLVRRSRWSVSVTLAAGLLGWTGLQVQRGYVASDRSDEYQEIRRFDALFEMLPDRSAVVSDDYLVDSMVRYKLLGEQAGRGRDIRGPVAPESNRLRQLDDAGFNIFAFAGSVLDLRLEGFRFAEATLFERRASDGTHAPGDLLTAGGSREVARGPVLEFDQRPTGLGMGHIPSLQLYRLLTPGSCEQLPSRDWIDIGRLARGGKVALQLSAGASLELYVGRDTPLRPRLTYVSDGSGMILRTGELDLLEVEGIASILTAPPSFGAGLTLTGTRSAIPEGATLVLGGIPDVAVARRAGVGDGEVRVCSSTLGYDGLFGDPTQSVERLDWRRNGHDELLGDGWTGQYPDRLRRITNTTGELLLPVWRRGALKVSITAARPEWMPGDRQGVIKLEVQGETIGTQSVSRGWTAYEWTIPARLVDEGVTQAYLRVSPVDATPDGLDRPRGIRVRDVTLTLEGPSR